MMMVHNFFGQREWIFSILNEKFAAKRLGVVPRFDDIGFGVIRLE